MRKRGNDARLRGLSRSTTHSHDIVLDAIRAFPVTSLMERRRRKEKVANSLTVVRPLTPLTSSFSVTPKQALDEVCATQQQCLFSQVEAPSSRRTTAVLQGSDVDRWRSTRELSTAESTSQTPGDRMGSLMRAFDKLFRAVLGHSCDASMAVRGVCNWVAKSKASVKRYRRIQAALVQDGKTKDTSIDALFRREHAVANAMVLDVMQSLWVSLCRSSNGVATCTFPVFDELVHIMTYIAATLCRSEAHITDGIDEAAALWNEHCDGGAAMSQRGFFSATAAFLDARRPQRMSDAVNIYASILRMALMAIGSETVFEAVASAALRCFSHELSLISGGLVLGVEERRAVCSKLKALALEYDFEAVHQVAELRSPGMVALLGKGASFQAERFMSFPKCSCCLRTVSWASWSRRRSDVAHNAEASDFVCWSCLPKHVALAALRSARDSIASAAKLCARRQLAVSRFLSSSWSQTPSRPLVPLPSATDGREIVRVVTLSASAQPPPSNRCYASTFVMQFRVEQQEKRRLSYSTAAVGPLERRKNVDCSLQKEDTQTMPTDGQPQGLSVFSPLADELPQKRARSPSPTAVKGHSQRSQSISHSHSHSRSCSRSIEKDTAQKYSMKH